MDPNLAKTVQIVGSFVAFILVAGWIAWVDARRRKMSIKTEADFRQQVLEKFSSVTEFADFVKTKEGRGFLNLRAGKRPGPLESIIRFVQVGTILAFVGFLGIVVGLAIPGPPGGGTAICGFLLAVGIGSLVASWVSYRLYKKWGLIVMPETKKPDTTDTPDKDAASTQTQTPTTTAAKAG